ncbi:MAG: hypothetical protein QF575_00905 [Acidimicrobiales bacterium]|nr:hypothetical protein [Acidimicrobiales bacterium]
MATSTGGALVVDEEVVGGALVVEEIVVGGAAVADEVVVEEAVVGGALVVASVAGAEALRTSEVVLVVPRSRITGRSDPPPQPEDSRNARSTLVRRARIAPV